MVGILHKLWYVFKTCDSSHHNCLEDALQTDSFYVSYHRSRISVSHLRGNRYLHKYHGYRKHGVHRSITPKFVTPTVWSCIDNSWRSTTHESAEETCLFNSLLGVVSCLFHSWFVWNIYPPSNRTKQKLHGIIFQRKIRLNLSSKSRLPLTVSIRFVSPLPGTRRN